MNQQQEQTFHTVVDGLQLSPHKAQLYIFVERFFSGELSEDDFLDALNDVGESLQLSDEQIVSLGEQLYTQLLSPHRDEIEVAFEKHKKPFGDVVREVMKDMSLTFEEPRFERRFSHICEVYLKDEYDRMRAKRTFMKGVTAGGMAYSDDVAARIVDRLDQYKGRVVFGGSVDEGVGDAAPVAGRRDEGGAAAQAEATAPKQPPEPGFVPDVASPVGFEAEHHTKDTAVVRDDRARGRHERKAVRSEVEGARHDAAAAPHELAGRGVDAGEKRRNVGTRDRAGDMDKRIDVALEARRIIKESGISYEDERMAKRLHDIVIARLKDVRGPYETRDAVMKSPESGGMGMDVHQAQQFLKHLEDANDVLAARWRKQAHANKQQYVEAQRRALFVKPPEVARPHAGKSSDIVRLVQQQPPEQRPVVLAEHLKKVKPPMHDVKSPPPLTNPVSELSSYTIEDFHRLHSDPHEAALKIEGKINLLREDSFGTMKQGVAAWKGSEVMRVYREQLQQSVVGGIPLSDVVERRKKAGMPYLTQDEVGALTKLIARLKG